MVNENVYWIYIQILFESTAAEAVDDMQRMNVADRMKNGKRPTVGGGPKADHNTEGRTKRPSGGRRGTHTGNTQTNMTRIETYIYYSWSL